MMEKNVSKDSYDICDMICVKELDGDIFEIIGFMGYKIKTNIIRKSAIFNVDYEQNSRFDNDSGRLLFHVTIYLEMNNEKETIEYGFLYEYHAKRFYSLLRSMFIEEKSN